MKKKSIIIVLLLMVVVLFTGCSVQKIEDMAIEEVPKVSINVGERLHLNNVYFDDTTNVLLKTEDGIIAINPGNIIITVNGKEYFLTVLPKQKEIRVSTIQKLKIGESTKLNAEVFPRLLDQEFTFTSTDEEVITVNRFGQVSAISDGMARVIVEETHTKLTKEVTYIVLSAEEKEYEDMMEMFLKNNSFNLDLTSNSGVMEAIINSNSNSIIGVSGYRNFNNFEVPPIFGSGVIYKMNVHYKDGTVLEDVKDLKKLNEIDYFEYYAITNRHIIQGPREIKVFIGDEYAEIPAELIQYDDKIDLALIKFSSRYYFPTCNFGDSDNVEKGEFIISIGNGTGKNDFRTHTFGVVSSPKRYVNTDTDGDMVNDWDSEYIQHDASINECDSGGVIVNMKGQIIGINSTKIIGDKFNNLSFAIPSNLVLNIVKILETGKRPQRATLGVSIVDVSAYQNDKEYFLQRYPFLQIPDDLKYGFYVIEVVRGGVCDKANVRKNDIIISFNNVEVKYSHQIRSELGKFLIGSGQKSELKVLRDGKLITLDVVF